MASVLVPGPALNGPTLTGPSLRPGTVRCQPRRHPSIGEYLPGLNLVLDRAGTRRTQRLASSEASGAGMDSNDTASASSPA